MRRDKRSTTRVPQKEKHERRGLNCWKTVSTGEIGFSRKGVEHLNSIQFPSRVLFFSRHEFCFNCKFRKENCIFLLTLTLKWRKGEMYKNVPKHTYTFSILARWKNNKYLTLTINIRGTSFTHASLISRGSFISPSHLSPASFPFPHLISSPACFCYHKIKMSI